MKIQLLHAAFFVLSLLCSTSVMAQQPKEIGKAVTMDGRRIILYENGTFRYEVAEMQLGVGTGVSPDTVQALFPSSAGGNFESSPYNKNEWRSTRTKFSVWYNPKKWKLSLANKRPPEEASWHMADTYCGVLTERLETDYETWIQGMKLRYKELDPQAKLVKEEWRTVNGSLVYHMVWRMNINRMKIQLYGYYAVGKGEIVQLVVQTPLSVVGDTEEEIYRILSGLKVYQD